MGFVKLFLLRGAQRSDLKGTWTIGFNLISNFVDVVISVTISVGFLSSK